MKRPRNEDDCENEDCEGGASESGECGSGQCEHGGCAVATAPEAVDNYSNPIFSDSISDTIDVWDSYLQRLDAVKIRPILPNIGVELPVLDKRPISSYYSHPANANFSVSKKFVSYIHLANTS